MGAAAYAGVWNRAQLFLMGRKETREQTKTAEGMRRAVETVGRRSAVREWRLLRDENSGVAKPTLRPVFPSFF